MRREALQWELKNSDVRRKGEQDGEESIGRFCLYFVRNPLLYSCNVQNSAVSALVELLQDNHCEDIFVMPNINFGRETVDTTYLRCMLDNVYLWSLNDAL